MKKRHSGRSSETGFYRKTVQHRTVRAGHAETLWAYYSHILQASHFIRLKGATAMSVVSSHIQSPEMLKRRFRCSATLHHPSKELLDRLQVKTECLSRYTLPNVPQVGKVLLHLTWLCVGPGYQATFLKYPLYPRRNLLCLFGGVSFCEQGLAKILKMLRQVFRANSFVPVNYTSSGKFSFFFKSSSKLLVGAFALNHRPRTCTDSTGDSGTSVFDLYVYSGVKE